MPKHLRIAPAFLLVCLLAPHTAQSAEPFEQVGYYVSAALLNPRGVRNLGMGDTGTASVNPVSSGCFNPATIAWTNGFLLAGETGDESYNFYDDATTASDVRLSVAARVADEWRVGGLVGFVSAERFQPFAGMFGLPPASGSDDRMLTVLGAASWTRGMVSIGAGFAAKHLDLYDIDLLTTDLSGWAFDLGLLTAFTFTPEWGMVRPRVGLASTNLDTGWPDTGVRYEIAGEFRIAMGLDIASSSTSVMGRSVPIVSGSIDLDQYSGTGVESGSLAVGMEVSILDLVQARIGSRDGTGDNTQYGFGLGWEFGRWMVRGDYAHWSAGYSFLEWDRDTFGLAAGMRL